MLLAASGDVASARRELRRVLAEDPDNGLAQSYLGVLRIDESGVVAPQDMSELGRYMPRAEAHHVAGMMLVQVGHVDRGVEHMKIGVDLGLNRLGMHIAASTGYLGAKRWDEAMHHAQMAVRLSPAYPAAHWLLAHSHAGKKEFDEWSREAMEAVRLGYRPLGPADHAFLGTARLAAKKPVDALASLLTATELGRRGLERAVVLAVRSGGDQVTVAHPRSAEFAALLKRATRLYPRNGLFNIWFGARLADEGAFDKALEELLLSKMLLGSRTPDLADIIRDIAAHTDYGKAMRRAKKRFVELRRTEKALGDTVGTQ